MLLNYLLAVILLSSNAMGKARKRQIITEQVPNAIKELMEWEIPEKIQKEFPLYLSGYDYEDRPVLVLEYGKWDTRKVADENGDDLRNLERRNEQLLERIKRGYFNKNTSNSEAGEVINEFVTIMDYDGLKINQFSVAGAKYMWRSNAKWEGCSENLAYGFIVNANTAADEMLNLTKPFWSKILGKLEVYGTNAEKFIPRIAKMIPQDQSPPAYGGHKDFKPVHFYG